jgi:hypothetical protein
MERDASMPSINAVSGPTATATGVLAAVVGYVLGLVVPPAAAILFLYLTVTSTCGPESVDCSWGFEYLLVLPVLAVSLLVFAPIGCAFALQLRGHDRAGATGWACVALFPLAPLMVFFLPAVVCIPIAARLWATRTRKPPSARMVRKSSAGQTGAARYERGAGACAGWGVEGGFRL